MTEKDKLEILLKDVKNKIMILDAIEKRLNEMKSIAMKSRESEYLTKEIKEMQIEIDRLISEIELLSKDSTIES